MLKTIYSQDKNIAETLISRGFFERPRNSGLTRDPPFSQVTWIPATWQDGNSFRHNNFAERITRERPLELRTNGERYPLAGAPVNRFIQAVLAHGHVGVYLTVSSAAVAIFLKLFRPGPLPARDDRDVKTVSSAAACSRICDTAHNFCPLWEGPLNIGRPRPSARHLAFRPIQD